MSTTYRGVAKSNAWRTRDQVAPHFTNEVRRDSKRARAEATAEFLRLLARVTPHDGATAWLEVSDRHGVRVLARYSGAATVRRQPCGDVMGGRWTLEEWRDPGAGSKDDGLPDFVSVGVQP